MHYQISRNGQTYGPYTLDDLQRYVATGNVLPTDLAKSDTMPDWVAVSQLLAAQPAAQPLPAAQQPAFAQPSYTAYTQANLADPGMQPMMVDPGLASSPYPDAPNLHWGLVLLFSVLTCYTIFNFIWDVVIAAWLRRVQPTDRSLFWYLGALGVEAVRFVLGISLASAVVAHQGDPSHFLTFTFIGTGAIRTVLTIAFIALIVTANFIKRASLLEHFNGPENVGLRLSGVMTFFFAPIYFQYHLNRINAMKQAARYSAPRAI